MFDGQAELERRASLHAALSELVRLRIVDALAVGDAAPSELAAMLDMVMSFSVLCTMGPGFVVPTIDMHTHFLSPAKPGRIVGEGAVVKKGRTISFMEGRLRDRDGRLLTTATGSGQLMKWPPEGK